FQFIISAQGVEDIDIGPVNVAGQGFGIEVAAKQHFRCRPGHYPLAQANVDVGDLLIGIDISPGIGNPALYFKAVGRDNQVAVQANGECAIPSVVTAAVIADHKESVTLDGQVGDPVGGLNAALGVDIVNAAQEHTQTYLGRVDAAPAGLRRSTAANGLTEHVLKV